jgi:catalase
MVKLIFMKTNDQNNFAKRTQAQVKSILVAHGVDFKPENMGDGRLFSVLDTSIKTRVAIKKAGFILDRSNLNDKVLYFKAF